MSAKPFAVRGLTAAGSLLLIVSAIHLSVTPLLHSLILRDIPGDVGRYWVAPFLLNHIVVGILLIPVALTTLFAASAAHEGTRWARKVALTNAISVMALPIALCLTMGPSYFTALPFLVASVVVIATAALMLYCALTLRSTQADS